MPCQEQTAIKSSSHLTYIISVVQNISLFKLYNYRCCKIILNMNSFYVIESIFSIYIHILLGFPGGVKNPPANAGDVYYSMFDPWVGKIPGVGNDNPFLYSCVENSLDRGTQRATVHRVAKNWHN